MNRNMRIDREAALDTLISRAAIQDILARYCRALDRCDGDGLKEAFWPDGHDDHGLFVGNIEDFVEFTIPSLRKMERTMHVIANCVIEFDDGDHARSETYVVAYHEIPGELGASHIAAGGRYLDRFERRSGEWRILERVYVLDWNQNQRSTADWNNALTASITKRGARFPDDPACGFLGTVSPKPSNP